MADGGTGNARGRLATQRRVVALRGPGRDIVAVLEHGPTAVDPELQKRWARAIAERAFGAARDVDAARFVAMLGAEWGWPAAPLKSASASSRERVAWVRQRLVGAIESGRLAFEALRFEEPQRGPAIELSAPASPPLGKASAWMALRIIDQEGKGVPRRAFHIQKDSQTLHEGYLDEEGHAHIDDLPAGTLDVAFPDIDPAERRAPDVTPGKRRDDCGPIANDASGPLFHIVQAGETLTAIAAMYSFLHWAPIWNHASNRALREARDEPQCLLPGDVVAIPERRALRLKLPTESEHVVTVYVQKPALRLRLVDAKGAPRAGVAAVLEVDGASSECSSDGDGVIEVFVTPAARAATLTVDDEIYELQVGGLGPVGEDVGVEGRLVDLGLVPPLEPLGESASVFRAEAEAFRTLGLERLERREGRSVEGKLTPALRDLLAEKVRS
jgi:hypothetical protein